MIDREYIKKQFFSDPGWHMVEELIMEYATPLIEMKGVDVTQPAEHVKAEVIGRQLAYDKLTEFLKGSGFIRNNITSNKTSFK